MATTTLSPEAVQTLKQEMRSVLLEMVPEIVKEFVPIITQIFKEITPVVAETTTQFCQETQQRQQQQKIDEADHSRIFADFQRRRAPEFDDLMKKRVEFHQRAITLEWKLNLYAEYLSRDVVYIPRTFRKDDYFVNNVEELAAVRNFEEARFKSEVDILTLRKNHMMREMAEIDDKVKSAIISENLPGPVEKTAIDHWYEFSSFQVKKIMDEETKKRASTIEAHKKDEEFYKKHQEERVKKNKSTTNTQTTTTNTLPSTSRVHFDQTVNKTSSSTLDSGVSNKGSNGSSAVINIPSNSFSRPIELVVVENPNDQSIEQENIVNMSTLNPIDPTEIPENDNGNHSKNQKGKEPLRKSPRTLSTSQEKT